MSNFSLFHPYKKQLPHHSIFKNAVSSSGIVRQSLVDGLVLNTGELIDIDVVVISHQKHFPHMKHIITTALGSRHQPIGFKDVKLNKVGIHSVKCFGAGGECLPHHLSNSWDDVERGVPDRYFRLGLRNLQTSSFMVEPEYVNTGLDHGLTEVVKDFALLLGAKDHWFNSTHK